MRQSALEELWNVPHLPVLCDALLQISAAADESCSGVGLPPVDDDFELNAWVFLTGRDTLCDVVDPGLARVLPKTHSPKVGMTLRSLSHHLAFVDSGDVLPSWYHVNRGRSAERSLNVLLIPWPRIVVPGDFRQVDGPLKNMNAEKFGFFTYVSDKDLKAANLEGILRRAREVEDRIDLVVMPELAVNESDYEGLRQLVVQNTDAMLVCGVGAPAEHGEFGKNYVNFATRFQLPKQTDRDEIRIQQQKHHRWLLDGSQISQYGLANSLPYQKSWWECIDISERKLTFVALEPWLTMSFLICEDLARQDPVSDLLRAVGPNLVVAILSDGPQLAARWPSRYATVLADDPGSSVLTLTNVGMVDLCRGPRRLLDSRPVALWKDALTGGPYELNLPADADALLLRLEVEYREEWAADGRSDNGTTSYLKLVCAHPISQR